MHSTLRKYQSVREICLDQSVKAIRTLVSGEGEHFSSLHKITLQEFPGSPS